MMPELIFSPSEFVGALNIALEATYPAVIIEGELSNFRISKSRWVYFDLKDDHALVKFFGTVNILPGPLEEGMRLRVLGIPRLSPQYGFSLTIQGIELAGEGTLKKAVDVLQAKLKSEGLFDLERKRPLPAIPSRIGLITSGESAAYADFTKILNERWGGVHIIHADVQVQGMDAPDQLVRALNDLNALANPVEVIVITRGGGSAEDLQAFNSEQVTRAVSLSRVPTIVAIGHEVDISLAELAADIRASTPSNAAQLLVPDRVDALRRVHEAGRFMNTTLLGVIAATESDNRQAGERIGTTLLSWLGRQHQSLKDSTRLLTSLSPAATLARGYAIVHDKSRLVRSAKAAKDSSVLRVSFHDGDITVRPEVQ